jgi:Ser-tRNA(Ala) deacylase AlaX
VVETEVDDHQVLKLMMSVGNVVKLVTGPMSAEKEEEEIAEIVIETIEATDEEVIQETDVDHHLIIDREEVAEVTQERMKEERVDVSNARDKVTSKHIALITVMPCVVTHVIVSAMEIEEGMKE